MSEAYLADPACRDDEAPPDRDDGAPGRVEEADDLRAKFSCCRGDVVVCREIGVTGRYISASKEGSGSDVLKEGVGVVGRGAICLRIERVGVGVGVGSSSIDRPFDKGSGEEFDSSSINMLTAFLVFLIEVGKVEGGLEEGG